MDRWSGLIIAFGIVIVMIMIASAVVDHINKARTIEFKTPYYALKSEHRELIE